MNEFVFLAEAWRDQGRTDDLGTMSLHLAEAPCSPLDSSEGFPDREVSALVRPWRAGEVAPGTSPAAAERPEPESAEEPEPRVIRNRRSSAATAVDIPR